jgi:short subunit dehydrogenase-like uncharacterized protein
MKSNQILLYGANGYTGRLIVALASDYGLKPLLSGRNETEIRQLGENYHLPAQSVQLSDKQKLYALLADTELVLHVAGPFRHTARDMIEACIQTKTHYLDITGEIEVFEMAKHYDSAAKEAGIMLMPGAGFDVVPTDCLALYLKNKLPDAVELSLAFANLGGSVSHGTALTMIEGLGEGGAVRINGKIIRKPLGHKGKWINFGLKKLFVMTIPWGDVSTAYHTTGIGNIETYAAAPHAVFRLLKLQSLFNWLLKRKTIKNILKKQVSKRAPGPTEEARKKAKSLVWGQVKNSSGEIMSATLETPDGYTLTANSSLIIARKVIAGDFKPGYQTPASAYGPDLILEVPGTRREDRGQQN